MLVVIRKCSFCRSKMALFIKRKHFVQEWQQFSNGLKIERLPIKNEQIASARSTLLQKVCKQTIFRIKQILLFTRINPFFYGGYDGNRVKKGIFFRRKKDFPSRMKKILFCRLGKIIFLTGRPPCTP